MRRIAGVVIAVVVGLGLLGCSDGGADDGAGDGAADTDQVDGGDGASNGDGSEGDMAEDDATSEGSGDLPDAPEIDPATMPEAGDVAFEVEGSTFEFAQADAASSAYACSVAPDAVMAELQVSGGTLAVQATEIDGVGWSGNITISHPDTERIYSSTPGTEGLFAIDGTMAVYEGAFSWRTSSDPALNEDAGTGVVRITC